MYCKNCGAKTDDDARFCPLCGTQLGATKTNEIISAKSEEMDRDALLLYFNNALSLECILSKLQDELSQTKKKINNTPAAYVQGCFEYDGSFYYWNEAVGIKHRLQADLLYYIEKSYPYKGRGYNEDWLDYIVGKVLYLIPIAGWYWLFVRYLEKKKMKKNLLSEFEQFRSIAENKYEEHCLFRKSLNQKRLSLQGEINEAAEMLNNYYKINVLPMQYRNIYAVYYINDFLRTSKERLTTALLHCDLDEIKNKLEGIISNQRQAIINQSIMIAQNEHMIRLNTDKLNYLSQISINADRTATYAQMAAQNAEICAWISAAEYIRNR